MSSPTTRACLSLEEELRSARSEAIESHAAQLDAARKVNDPERVLELHQGMMPLLDHEARASLEADLSKWFLKLIHNRLRTGKIQADVAILAGRIADVFCHTVEGASLRAPCPRSGAVPGSAPAAPNPIPDLRTPAPSAWPLPAIRPRLLARPPSEDSCRSLAPKLSRCMLRTVVGPTGKSGSPSKKEVLRWRRQRGDGGKKISTFRKWIGPVVLIAATVVAVFEFRAFFAADRAVKRLESAQDEDRKNKSLSTITKERVQALVGRAPSRLEKRTECTKRRFTSGAA